MSKRLPPAILLAAIGLTAGLTFQSHSARAQTCWAYVDGVNATPPIECVQASTLTGSCFYPSDCTTIPAGSPQTLLTMHTEWHDCFGNTGGSSPPEGRGQRWYAFHRQFEYDFNLWRMNIGFDRIESVDWCPPLDTDSDGTDDTFTNLAVGHGGAGLDPGDHPANCGLGDGRPSNTDCDTCEAFPQCMFHTGAGPLSCPGSPGSSCQGGSASFPHTSLDQFENVDDVALILDAQFHGDMHQAVSDGDFGNWGPSFNNDDCAAPDCSPRDPMFWRLHKALDDVVRAWQDFKAVDVILIVDRSGSMNQPDPSGTSKLQAAVDAVDYFADLLEHNRPDGQTNRIGLVSYSTNSNLDLSLTPVDPNLRNPGSPFVTALNGIQTTGASGCTGIGGAIETALAQLCPNGGDCRLNQVPPPAGTNLRKAILLLTDGVENISPCLQPAGPSGGSCMNQCFGTQIDYDELDVTQLVAVGFGNSTSLNGDLLELIAERQGGIYTQNPTGPTDDLKYFYTMAFGQLTDEFVFVDPKGQMAPADPVSEPVEYTACGNDNKITFTSGWQRAVPAGDLRLLVTTPSGDLVRPGSPGIQANTEDLWSHVRIPFPHDGESSGTWRGHLIRPHLQFVNGFAPDAFADLRQGVAIVRREIQRLCPDGCRNVLFFQQGVQGRDNAYEAALRMELESGLLGNVERPRDGAGFERQLGSGRWDLIVFAHMGPDRRERYDDTLSRLLCRGQKAVVTDARIESSGAVYECLGVAPDGTRDWDVMEGDRRLVDGYVKMTNPGYQFATFGLRPTNGTLAWANAGKSGAVHANATRGDSVNWFIDVLGQGLGKVTPVNMRMDWSTTDVLRPSARILPSYVRAGGWDHVDARVEIEYPTVGIGTLLSRKRERDRVEIEGETLSERAAALAGVDIPTKTVILPLYDDGTHSDVEPRNAQWTTEATGIPAVDGTYNLRYIFDLTADGCTTRREASHSVEIEARLDPDRSGIDMGSVDFGDGILNTTFTITPADRHGNLLGPGLSDAVFCAGKGCRSIDVVDNRDGSYELRLTADANAGAVRLDAFGSPLDLGLPCVDGCPQLGSIQVLPRTIIEHEAGKGVLTLVEPVKQEVVVYLVSSRPVIATVPESIVFEPGQTESTFEVDAHHGHEAREHVTISARLGDQVRSAPVMIRPPRDESRDQEQRPDSLRQPHYE